ncbi:hypothetical protein D3C79_937080 [compost metagenome]
MASSGDKRVKYFCLNTVCMLGKLLAFSSTCRRPRMRLRILPASPNTGTATPWDRRKTAINTMPRNIKMNSPGIWFMAAEPPSTQA